MTTDTVAPPKPPSPVHRLGRADLGKCALAILVGTAGGALFSYLNMPLPWMMGSMFAAGMITLSGVELKMDTRLRTLMILVIGTLLGGAFSPSLRSSSARRSAPGSPA